VSGENDGYLVEQLIVQIQAGHESAACQLREFLGRGVRWFLGRNGDEASVEENSRQVLDAVIQAVKDCQVGTAAELTSFTRTSAKAFAGNGTSARQKTPPIDLEQVECIKHALQGLSARERDALVRYFEGQHPERICADLGMSESAFDALRFQVRTRSMQPRTAS
jgi:hypothetical protein